MKEITYQDIEKANELISTTNIKGKEYAEVPQRVKAFRSLFPLGTIDTEMISHENGLCVMKATVADENGRILGVGHAYEKEGSSFINNTSYIENCETSAVGRALGFIGLGIDTAMASYEEVANAKKQQEEIPKITEKQARDLRDYAESLDVSEKEICKRYRVKTIEDMNAIQLASAKRDLNATAQERGVEV